MFESVFITGTDTGIGKTRFTLALMNQLKKQGRKVSGMKPIATGAIINNGKLINEDAKLIMGHCSKLTEYELINPAVYELPVSPNLASKQKKEIIDLGQIVDCYKLLASNSENIIVEGVVGWRVPVSDKLSLVDLVRALNLPVILVVGLRLGCINHAILTTDAIKADGITLLGWVSNRLDKEYLLADETIETLKSALDCPYLADLPYMESFDLDKISESIDLSGIFDF